MQMCTKGPNFNLKDTTERGNNQDLFLFLCVSKSHKTSQTSDFVIRTEESDKDQREKTTI